MAKIVVSLWSMILRIGSTLSQWLFGHPISHGLSMFAGSVNARMIGCHLRKPHWTECSLQVLDIGQIYVFGHLYNHRLNEPMGIGIYPRSDNDWEYYIDAQKFIDLIPIKEPRKSKRKTEK